MLKITRISLTCYPHYIKDIKLVKGVQCRSAKLVWGMENLRYEERL